MYLSNSIWILFFVYWKVLMQLVIFTANNSKCFSIYLIERIPASSQSSWFQALNSVVSHHLCWSHQEDPASVWDYSAHGVATDTSIGQGRGWGSSRVIRLEGFPPAFFYWIDSLRSSDQEERFVADRLNSPLTDSFVYTFTQFCTSSAPQTPKYPLKFGVRPLESGCDHQ